MDVMMENYTAVSPRISVTPKYSVVFSFEENFDAQFARQWMKDNWHQVFYYVFIYVVLIYAGKNYMKERPRYELRYLLFLWNVSLATFSIIGSLRTWPEFIHVLREFGFTFSVCNPSFVTQTKVSGFWSWMFILSKAPELLDTLFIVARKRKLIFLHWYHHISVLVCMWYGSASLAATARWFVNMNYFIHSWMYSYYALRAIGFKLPKTLSIFITSMQILQMMAGCFTVWWAYRVKKSGQFCYIPDDVIYLSMFIGVTYLVLFVKYFYDAYLRNERSLKKKQS